MFSIENFGNEIDALRKQLEGILPESLLTTNVIRGTGLDSALIRAAMCVMQAESRNDVLETMYCDDDSELTPNDLHEVELWLKCAKESLVEWKAKVDTASAAVKSLDKILQSLQDFRDDVAFIESV